MSDVNQNVLTAGADSATKKHALPLVAWFDGLSPRWQLGLKTLGALAFVHILFWAIIQPTLFMPPDRGDVEAIEFSKTELAHLAAPTLESLASAKFEPVELPHTECCKPEYLALRLTFDRPEQLDAAGLGLINYQQVDNYIVALNGSIIFAQGNMMVGHQTFDGQLASFSRIPTGLLRPTGNQLVYLTVRQGLPYTDLVPPLLGAHDKMRDWSASRFWQMRDYVVLSGWVTFIVGIFAAFLALRGGQARFAFWLMALAFSLSALSLYGQKLDLPISGTGRMFYFFAANMAVMVSLLCFIDEWSRRPLKWLQPAMVGLWLAFSAFCLAYLLFVPMPNGYDIPATVWTWAAIGFGVAIFARLLLHFFQVREDRYWEAAILSIVGVAIGLDGISSMFNLDRFAFLRDAAPLLLVAMTAAFLHRNFHLFQSAADLNAHLSAQLAQREQELAQSLDALKAQEAKTAIETERARIMRDMHDGMGGQLLNLLFQVRNEETPRAQLENSVQASITDLRLLIDSLDTVGDSLDIALALFKERLEPRLKQAHCDLEWPIANLDWPRILEPAEILSVYRILQEAVSNALRHGKATKITISPQVTSDAMTIMVADNGPKLLADDNQVPPFKAGRGLTNMMHRAQILGGSLKVSAGAGGGALVSLTIPTVPPKLSA